MLSKCLWKMYSCDDAVRGPSKRIDIDDLIDSLLDGIEALPQRKDTRSEPIFEPHYKLVSIVHKLVRRGVLKVKYHAALPYVCLLTLCSLLKPATL